jgi:hypothetical protein
MEKTLGIVGALVSGIELNPAGPQLHRIPGRKKIEF